MKPDVFNSHDYLEYLTSWIEHQRSTHPAFSLRQLAALSGIAPSLLSMILRRERNMTDGVFQQILTAMKVSKSERDVLQLLKIIDDSNDQDTKIAAFQKLKKIPQYREKHKETSALFEFMTDWLQIAIRELACQNDFQDKPIWIQARLRKKISLPKISKALLFLKSEGFMIQSESGRWMAATNENLQLNEGIFRLSLGKFHCDMLDLAKEAIDSIPRNERFLTGHTVSLSQEQQKLAESILIEAINRIQLLAKQPQVNQEVVHFELSCIPLTHRPGGEKE